MRLCRSALAEARRIGQSVPAKNCYGDRTPGECIMTDTGYQAVIPMLAYEDAAAALDWLAAAFGFTEITRMVGEEGTIGHAEPHRLATPCRDLVQAADDQWR